MHIRNSSAHTQSKTDTSSVLKSSSRNLNTMIFLLVLFSYFLFMSESEKKNREKKNTENALTCWIIAQYHSDWVLITPKMKIGTRTQISLMDGGDLTARPLPPPYRVHRTRKAETGLWISQEAFHSYTKSTRLRRVTVSMARSSLNSFPKAQAIQRVCTVLPQPNLWVYTAF